NKQFEDNEKLKRQIEKQIEAAVWLQAIGQISEAVLLYKLSLISVKDDESENMILLGSFIQAIGLIFGATGVSSEVSSDEQKNRLKGEKLAVTGDGFQTIGAFLSTIGGIDSIKKQLDQFIP